MPTVLIYTSCLPPLYPASCADIPTILTYTSCSPPPQPPPQFHYSRNTYIYYRTQVLQHIDQEHHILSEVIKSLQEYMDLVRAAKESESCALTWFVSAGLCIDPVQLAAWLLRVKSGAILTCCIECITHAVLCRVHYTCM